MTKTVETVDLRDAANKFSDARVKTMTKKIEESFARRDEFEGANATNSASSYAKNRDKMLNNKIAVARAFLALGIEASDVIERKVTETKMFNAKALKKIVELSQFIVTDSRKIEKVMSAFIVCALKFSDNAQGAISNSLNKGFVSKLDFSQIVTDAELADYLADYQHAYISGGKDTQSSQARNVLDVLGLASIVNCENRYRGGIEINSEHAFYQLFASAFTK